LTAGKISPVQINCGSLSMVDKKTEKKNKTLAIILTILAIISAAGAVIWFNMYAPLVLR
jgi:hypothetical protein